MKFQLKEEYVIEKIVNSQTIAEEDTLVDIIVKLNLNINVKIKYKTKVIQNLANLSETRTLCQFSSIDPRFSVIYLIFVPAGKFLVKQVLKNNGVIMFFLCIVM